MNTLNKRRDEWKSRKGSVSENTLSNEASFRQSEQRSLEAAPVYSRPQPSDLEEAFTIKRKAVIFDRDDSMETFAAGPSEAPDRRNPQIFEDVIDAVFVSGADSLRIYNTLQLKQGRLT